MIGEIGFWEYTTPGGGACPHYQREDWRHLLQQMAQAGMNSLSLVIKWYTTGYCSKLPWLDQDQSCQIIKTENDMLHFVITEAHDLGIRVWLTAVCSFYQVQEFGILPPNGRDSGVFHYDPDYPGVSARMASLFTEIATLFPDVHGLVVEMESVEFDWPHRIPLYNEWAQEKGYPSHAELRALPLDARSYRIHAWREFLTWRRVLVLQHIEQTVRETGFSGKLAMILETGNEAGAYIAAIDLPFYASAMNEWAAVTYDYHRNMNRFATRDFCLEQPRALGLETYYLGRGVMTFMHEQLSIPLSENWRRDLQDATAAGANGLWFFGADAVPGPHFHASTEILQKMGYKEGQSARQALLQQVTEFFGG